MMTFAFLRFWNPFEVKALFTKATVETFIASILPRLSRSNSRPLNIFLAQSLLNRPGDELGTMGTA